ncbi:hypothetical protein ACHAXA_007641 [Cyclostephanos tholiformis]|uniref:Uncharacterized protein n=1 Tax=Cyclostephanos tholiformis TaxID=382380 RepID=A0ABD3SDB3_9STRA
MKTTAWPTAILVVIAINDFTFVDALSSSSSSSSSSCPPPQRIVLRVCTSPGCKDDGAQSTLDRLLAFAPHGVDVVGGGCVSLCGSGPVVEVDVVKNNLESRNDGVVVASKTTTTTTKRRRVKGGEAIASLLNECVATTTTTTTTSAQVGADGDVVVARSGTSFLKPHMLDRLTRGYELSIEADMAYASKDYELAVDLYADAIESGRKPALSLQEAREEVYGVVTSSDDGDAVVDRGVSPGTAMAHGARRDAFAATIFSRNTDPDAHECLAMVCRASDDALGELQGLKSAVREHDRVERECSSPMPGSDAPARADAARRRSHAAARKRELGFRIVTLEKMLRG